LWGGMNLGTHFRVMAFVPYYINKQVDDDGITNTNGLGDITLMGQYQLFRSNVVTKSNKVVKQQLWVGLGVKLPTGSFNVNVNDSATTVADINAQLGTGSTDILLNALYNLNINNWGLNVSANYKINTAKDGYLYGNKLTTNAIAYYRLEGKKITVLPNVGVGYEQVDGNLLNGKKVEYTGSHVTTALAGVEFNFHKVGFGANVQLPVEQNFAEGQTELKLRGMAHITFAF